MKALIFCLTILLALVCNMVACSSKDTKPNPGPVVTPTPVPTPVPTPTPPAQGKDAALCKKEGNKFSCGTNEWWHLSCSGDEKNEQVYFLSKEAVAAKADEKFGKDQGSCVKITFKNGTEEIVHFGFGPCLPCQEL